MKKIVVLITVILLTSVLAAADSPSHTCYEVFVYSFFDTDGDGIGDLNGVNRKLDYICGDENGLGCDMIWLMPVFPSPTYHKYDVTDYKAIDPQYGTLEDMDLLIKACHERGVRLILDLPLNHTSSAHPWFEAAAAYMSTLEGREPDSSACPYLDYYNFSRAAKRGYAALKGTSYYYEARFWEGMPDLNLDHEEVRREIEEIVSFWLGRGVDGFRLDAVTSYDSESRQKSIDFVAWLTEYAKEIDPDCYLVGEAWTDQASYLPFYASGIDSLFDFAFAGQEGVIAKVTRGNKPASWFAEKMAEEEGLIRQYGDYATNAPFYTNHDMARSAGYYPADGGARTKFALALNLLMPGNAFLYYGEELGMNGSGKDENKRAPMNWGQETGMCSGPPGIDEIAMMYPSYEEQKNDANSIYSVVRDMIGIRQRYPAIASGRTQPVSELTGIREVSAFIRTLEGEQSVLVVINASPESQTVDLTVEGYPATESAFTLTPYAIAIIGEGEENRTVINEGCVLPEKKTRRRRS